MRGWGVVDPPEVRFRVYRFAFVGGPRRGLDQFENCPPRLIEHSTGSTKGASDAIWPACSSATRQPTALKSSGRPFQELQTTRCKLESVEDSGLSTAEHHCI